MTNHEAKAIFLVLRERWAEALLKPEHGTPEYLQALDIALWWAEQAELVDAVMEPYANKDELQERWDQLNAWRHEHPRPGS